MVATASVLKYDHTLPAPPEATRDICARVRAIVFSLDFEAGLDDAVAVDDAGIHLHLVEGPPGGAGAFVGDRAVDVLADGMADRRAVEDEVSGIGGAGVARPRHPHDRHPALGLGATRERQVGLAD